MPRSHKSSKSHHHKHHYKHSPKSRDKHHRSRDRNERRGTSKSRRRKQSSSSQSESSSNSSLDFNPLPPSERNFRRHNKRGQNENRRKTSSEERLLEEERKKQTRLAKARLLSIMEKKEEGSESSSDEMPSKVPSKSEKYTKEIVPKEHKEIETKSEGILTGINNPNIELNIKTENDIPFKKESNQPESQDLIEKKGEITSLSDPQVKIEQINDTKEHFENPTGKEGKNEIDTLDSFMIGIQKEVEPQYFENPLDNPEIQKEIMNIDFSLNNTKNSIASKFEQKEIEDDPEEENYRKEFLSKLKSTDFNASQPTQLKNKGREEPALEEEDKYIMEIAEMEDLEDEILKKETNFFTKKNKKDLIKKDSEFEPFKKKFYLETDELKKLAEKDVKEIRKKMDNIKVRGVNVPKPILNWYQCGLRDCILNVIEKKQFKEPFPIQAQAIPAIMSGRDVIGIAETGSGKTLAYLLPMLRHVLDQRSLKSGEGPIGLVLSPTRELTFQIYRDIKPFAKACKLRVTSVFGGSGLSNQLTELKKGVEIIVCTPGRMIDVLSLSNGKITNLKRVTYVVLDEADRMLDLGFEPQISRILSLIRPDKQIVMFSATFPRCIENLARRTLQDPLEIVVGNRGQACRNVEQFVEVFDESEKFRRLLDLLGRYSNEGKLLIFVEKQIQADNMFKELYNFGYQALVIHGGQDQTDRDFTIDDFKKGVRNILVATSLAARGLDIKNIIMVINYSCPTHMEDYVHRVGRTGRAGNKGIAYTLITPDECQFAGELIKALKLGGNDIPEELENLDKDYREKVAKGEIEYYRPKGFVGKGYNYSEEEDKKLKQFRKELSKSYGYNVEESDSDEEIKIKDKNERNEDSRPIDQVIADKIRDPKIREAALDAATNAAKIAIAKGLDEEQIRKSAEDAIRSVVSNVGPTSNGARGLEKAIKIVGEFLSNDDGNNSRCTAEVEINDYPPHVRMRATNRDFLHYINEITGCNVTVRGVFLESGKKLGPGQRKQFIHIDGISKPEVQNAYREVKNALEQNTLSLSDKPAHSNQNRFTLF